MDNVYSKKIPIISHNSLDLQAWTGIKKIGNLIEKPFSIYSESFATFL